jgi:parallel beta-helix repeat protein
MWYQLLINLVWKARVKGFSSKLRILISLILSAGILFACLSNTLVVPSPTPAIKTPTRTPLIEPSQTPTQLTSPQPSATSAGTRWYVAASGSDTNPGTLNRPWLTIQYAVDHAQPGDFIFVRGGSYAENIIIHKNGTPSAPITLTAYPDENVVIDGRTNITIRSAGAVSYWIIEGLTLKSAARYTLRIGWWDEPMTDHWIIRNNTLLGANFLMGFNHLWENNNISGLGYTGAEGDAGITEGGDSHHNIYRGNTIHDFTQKEARGFWSQGKTHDSLVENNTFINIIDNSGSSKGQCIDLDGAAEVEWRHTVRGNRLSNCNYVGIQLENTFESTIENNLIANTRSAGIVVINYNSDTGCKTGGESNQYGDITGKGDCRGVDTHNAILQNILYNAGDVGAIVSYESSGVKVYHNLVYASGTALYINESAVYSKNWDVRGNIFSNNRRTELSIVSPDSFSYIDNNLIYHPGADLFFEVRSPVETFYSFSDWQNKFNLDLHSINADPVFVNPAGFDFHLQSHSPAVGAGINLNLSTDFDGLVRS